MELLDRVVSNVIFCGIEISFYGVSVPSIIEDWQPFYNSTFESADFKKTYASLISIDFSEENSQSNAGTSYKQKISFRFPNSDAFRANRIALFQKTKYVKLKQTNGLDIVIGRNDYYQNALPVIRTKTNEQLTEIEIETQSIFPSGFTPNPNAFGFPALIPLNLI